MPIENLRSVIIVASILLATISQITYGQISGDEERVDITRANEIALADEGVQKYIAGRPYYLMSYGITSNENEPGVVYPTLLYNIDNKDQLSVTVDLRAGNVKDLLYLPDFMPKFKPAVEKERSTNVIFVNIIAIVASMIAAAVAAVTIFFLKSKKKKEVLR